MDKNKFQKQTAFSLLLIIIVVFAGSASSAILVADGSAKRFVCTNGKNPTSLSHHENLMEFSKGPCSPIMILPGLFTSVLTVEIDCPTLKSQNPEVFKACGWTDCTKKALELWKSVPDKEYRLWIPPLTSKLNIFTLDEKANECFAKFFKLDLDPSKPLEQAITPPIGFTVRP